MIKRKQNEMEQELKFIDDLAVTLDSDDDEQAPSRDAQAHESLDGKIKSETASDEQGAVKSDEVGNTVNSIDDAQVPKTIQDELNELTNAAATNYELHFEEDEGPQAL